MRTYAYDPDRYDAEIILDRTNVTAPFTAHALCAVLNVHRDTIARWKREGKVPPPAVVGKAHSPTAPDEWDREQVIDMLVAGLRMTDSRFKPINHGTAAGYSQHYRRGEKACPDCLRAKTSKSTADRRKAMSAA